VDHVLLVHVGERLTRLADVLDRIVRVEPGSAARGHELGQAAAADELHHEVMAAALAEVPDHANDARVVEPRQQPRLDLKPRRVAQVQQALDGHLPAGVDVPRPHDLTHAAARDRADDRVRAAEQEPGLERDDRFALRHASECSPLHV
jgi:hypothetical protein